MIKQIYHIALFASGKGSNAEKIINYFKNNEHIKVSVVLSNKKDAPVLEMAKSKNVLTKTFTKQELENGFVENFLVSMGIDLIVLAGFLLKIPEELIKRFPNKIINIHPSLLPKYGGKGMYGINVHQAVIENREKESGITIHLVNEEYDKGRILLQEKCPVFENDSPEDLAKRIQILEHEFYAPCIEKYILNNG
jgi:phosphoribosylglycinamide formyltransferase-1